MSHTPKLPPCGHAETADGCEICRQLALATACGHTRRDAYDPHAPRPVPFKGAWAHELRCGVCGGAPYPEAA